MMFIKLHQFCILLTAFVVVLTTTEKESQKLKCLTKFEELIKNSGFSGEKQILEGGDVADFCKLKKKLAKELVSYCYPAPIPDDMQKVASSAVAICYMIDELCEHIYRLNPLPKGDQMCGDSVKIATTFCLRQSGVSSIQASSVVYPTDLLIRMMKDEGVSPKIAYEASQMQRGACPADAQKTLLNPSYLTRYYYDIRTTTTTKLTSTTTQSPLLFFWNDSDSPKYTGCLAITQGPFNRPYQNLNSDERSNCNSHLTCREKHPGNSAALCLRTDANRFCCKSIEFRVGKHFESDCLGECSDGDHAYCGHRSLGQKPAECYQGDHPFHKAFGSVGCCRAEYVRHVLPNQ